MAAVGSHEEAKRELMRCVTNALVAMENDLQLRIANLCKHTWQMPAAVGVNMATSISKEVHDLIAGGIILQVDRKIGDML